MIKLALSLAQLSPSLFIGICQLILKLLNFRYCPDYKFSSDKALIFSRFLLCHVVVSASILYRGILLKSLFFHFPSFGNSNQIFGKVSETSQGGSVPDQVVLHTVTTVLIYCILYIVYTATNEDIYLSIDDTSISFLSYTTTVYA